MKTHLDKVKEGLLGMVGELNKKVDALKNGMTPEQAKEFEATMKNDENLKKIPDLIKEMNKRK